jgi:hypothetical protein
VQKLLLHLVGTGKEEAAARQEFGVIAEFILLEDWLQGGLGIGWATCCEGDLALQKEAEEALLGAFSACGREGQEFLGKLGVVFIEADGGPDEGKWYGKCAASLADQREKRGELVCLAGWALGAYGLDLFRILYQQFGGGDAEAPGENIKGLQGGADAATFDGADVGDGEVGVGKLLLGEAALVTQAQDIATNKLIAGGWLFMVGHAETLSL